VFDPYGGIGTTTSEALRLGRKSWCVELNRVAALAAYVSGVIVLLRLREPRLLESLLSALAGSIAATERTSLFGGPSSLGDGMALDRAVSGLVEPTPLDFLGRMSFGAAPNELALGPWYHRNTLANVLSFSRGLADQDSAMLQLMGLMAVSACLKALSSQTRSWGHIADNVLPKNLIEKDFSKALRRWHGRLSKNLQSAKIEPIPTFASSNDRYLHVSIHDWKAAGSLDDAVPNERAKVLITSPPYGGAIDYVLSQRLSYYLLGANDDDLMGDQRNEIGARRRRFSDKSRDLWAQNLCECVKSQIEYLDVSGTAIVVMPHKSEGRSNGNEIVDETLRKACWMKQYSIDRSIRSQRARQAWTSIKRETISFYVRRDGTDTEGR